MNALFLIGGVLLLRLAQSLLFGIAAGLLLRWLFGRRSLPLWAVLAQLPLVATILAEARRGGVHGLAPATTTVFVLVGSALAVAGMLLGAFRSLRWPWLVALTPTLTGLAFLAMPYSRYNAVIQGAPVDPLRFAGIVGALFMLTLPFTTGLLAVFAPARLGDIDRLRYTEPTSEGV